jgi:1-acyl-sn-glycerol-3-phosphate acyltransferase
VARAARELILGLVLGPLIDRYTLPKVLGLHHLTEVDFPVIFVANHSSHMDTPVLLRALPSRWRSHTVVMAAAD